MNLFVKNPDELANVGLDDFGAVLERAIACWSDIDIDGLEWQRKLRAEWDRTDT